MVLDKLVIAARGEGADGLQGHALQLVEIEPWPDAVEGGELLHDLVRAMLRYVVMAEDDALAAALWVLHSYVFDVFTCTPRLCITSPEKRCGKTTLLDIIGCLVSRPLAAADITSAAIFERSIQCGLPSCSTKPITRSAGPLRPMATEATSSRSSIRDIVLAGRSSAPWVMTMKREFSGRTPPS